MGAPSASPRNNAVSYIHSFPINFLIKILDEPLNKSSQKAHLLSMATVCLSSHGWVHGISTTVVHAFSIERTRWGQILRPWTTTSS